MLGTAITSTARRAVKTPANNVARKLLSKAPIHTDAQLARIKPRAPPPPPPELPMQSSIITSDQSLDFSLLHTMKNVYGQIKVIRSKGSLVVFLVLVSYFHAQFIISFQSENRS